MVSPTKRQTSSARETAAVISASHQRIADANRRYYAKTALEYDATENCVTDEAQQSLLLDDLKAIVRRIDKERSAVRALDACGGNGNVALKLNQMQIPVTLCDISPELTRIYETRCHAMSIAPHVVISEIGDFLARTTQPFDLIVFSSALHHLQDIDSVLSLAYERLAPNGFLYTVFDPTPIGEHHRLGRAVMKLDYYAFKLLRQPRDLPGAVMRKLRRLAAKRRHTSDKAEMALNNENLGLLAEYHVEKGIDDHRLVAHLSSIGFEQIWHRRYSGGRYKATVFVLSLLGDRTAFKLLMQKK